MRADMLSDALATNGVGREHDADCGPTVRTGIDREVPTQRASALRDLVEARPPALARTVVRDHGLDSAVGRFGDADRDLRRRATANRLVEGLADDLIDGDLRALLERLRDLDVE